MHTSTEPICPIIGRLHAAYIDSSLTFGVAVHVLLQQMSEEQSYCKSIVKKQQQQAQLSKLPRHHPLIREVHSDDGTQLFGSSARCNAILCGALE